MAILIPDSIWCKKMSTKRNVQSKCPYANLHKCHRYFDSINLLGQTGMITTISDDKRKELFEFWKSSGVYPEIAEELTSVSPNTLYVNFCPEVSNTYLGYYASFLAKYADEIDCQSGQRKADIERIQNDWRYAWQDIKECHFVDCDVYDEISEFNNKQIGKFDGLAHKNIIPLIQRMELCLDSDDPSGVLHASANILETMAKDIIGDAALETQTLGSFIERYKKESMLPDSIKDAVAVIYGLRNRTPLSGHGSTNPPNISMEDAVIFAAMTKFVVEVEYRTRRTERLK